MFPIDRQDKKGMNSYTEDRISPAVVWTAAAVSLLIHVLLVAGFHTWIFVSPDPLSIDPPTRRVALRFVDSPDRIEPVEEVPPTDLISDRSSLAQDMVPDRAEEDVSPRAVGIAPTESVRKEPSGEPKPVEAPPREEVPERDLAEGVGAREDPAVPAERIAAAPGTESPILGRGPDSYYSPEEDSPEGRARILKQISYNMRSTEVGRYMARLAPRVTNLWHFNVRQSTFYVRSERTHVLFKIMPDGSVGKLLVNRHDGPDLEMRYGLNAIERAQPFEPLSEEILEYVEDDGLWLQFNFRYHW